MKRWLGPFATLALAFAGATHAEVRQAVPDGFVLSYAAPVKGDAKHAWASLVAVPSWWSREHTWSGKAGNLSLKPDADGCFCERWPGGSAVHGRVLMALPERMLRIDAALGPLQEFALTGVLTFWIRTADDGSTRLELEYRVNGSSASGLDEFAPKVDGVLGEQFARLVRYADTGDPEPPPAPPSEADARLRNRSAVLEQWRQQALEEQAKKDAAAKPPAKEPKR
ncbi:MAG: hypothetical protein ACTHK2_00150 [Dokdonella sp.]|uniref:hypothetical protein n=1 Tax=Dokdonella sp. TaxID=2291710 RepID=UPI003F801F71